VVFCRTHTALLAVSLHSHIPVYEDTPPYVLPMGLMSDVVVMMHMGVVG